MNLNLPLNSETLDLNFTNNLCSFYENIDLMNFQNLDSENFQSKDLLGIKRCFMDFEENNNPIKPHSASNLNYSRVSSKATSAISSFPFINQSENDIDQQSMVMNFNPFDLQCDEFFDSNMDNFLKFSFNEDQSDQSLINSLQNEHKGDKLQKKTVSTGNPINKVIELITKENLTFDKGDDLFNCKNELQTEELGKKKLLFTSRKISSVDFKKHGLKKCCSCKKSHCLKLYCECFKGGLYCENCTCPNCLNKEKFELFRQQSINFLKSKSKHAFKPVKMLETESKEEKHIKGCKCKNSSCKKNYCECYQNGMKCSDLCKCLNCMNGTCNSTTSE